MKQMLFSLLLLVLLSCNDDNDSVRLRLENTSSSDFDAVYVAATGPEVSYGSLEAGKVSDYIEFSGIYRYAYIRIETNGTEYVLQPIDYVGETLYTYGNYTYVLDIANPADMWSVTLEFRKD